VDSLVPARIEGVRSPRAADDRTLRMCDSEHDAVLVSIRLSTLTYREIAARVGLSKSTVDKWAHGKRIPDKHERAFCGATGTLLLTQYRVLHRLLSQSTGRTRKADRIAAIAAPTERKWVAA
jgi:hypothetical protein